MFNKLIASVKGVMVKMGLLKTLQDVKNHKKISANSKDYDRIAMWKDLYRGKYDDWHQLTYKHNGETIQREMLSMEMPKVTANYLAKLIFNEKAIIKLDNEAANEFVQNTLSDNGFYKNFKRYLEYCMAMGGMAMKVYSDGKRVKIAYATADAFFPISSDSEHVDEAVFVSTFRKHGKYYTLFEWNEWIDNKYVITNELYRSDTSNDVGIKVDLAELFKGIVPRIEFPNVSRPFFVYLKPNIANNKDETSPLGLSVYANALNTLKFLDTTFDAYYQEIVLGKKRVMVPINMIKTSKSADGSTKQFFDTRDEVFHVYDSKNMDSEGNAVKDISIDIRAEAFISSLNAQLRIYAMQIGLSPGAFTFDEQGLKTATEVISEKSDTYQTKNDHSLLVEEALKELIISILEVGKLNGAYNGEIVDPSTISIDFDDSIAQDTDTTINRWTNAKNQGMVPTKIAIKRAFDITPEEAEKWYEMIQAEKKQSATQNDMSGIFGAQE
ncbi:portal protein [Bacillus cereus]|uniref:Portal protein n=2 Tax=Bacillus cereus TaxID=1396 RepID=A0A9X7BG44_BACCE|nr:phage portal protein [Bacillus cereus]PED41959.1 portal protein [Bacillus cereus]PFV11225.1 portal protein [Bacillus cereus]